MDILFEKTLAAAQGHGAKNVLVALGTGKTALRAREVFPSDYRVFAVGNRAGVVGLDDGGNKAVPDSLVQDLESAGVDVLICGASPFQHIARGVHKLETGGHELDFRGTWGKFPGLSEVLQTYTENRNLNPISLLLNFCDWFGAGFQVAIEIMLLAADSGLLPVEERVISVVRPYEPRSACYVVMRPCQTEDLFSRSPEILAIELIPKE